jgi:hypothetical protein
VHREHYTTDLIAGTRWSRNHTTRVPSLLAQLEHSMPSSQGESSGARGFESRPAARLEALDALIRIDRDSADWCVVLDPDRAVPSSTAGGVVRLGSLLPRVERCHRAKAGAEGPGDRLLSVASGGVGHPVVVGAGPDPGWVGFAGVAAARVVPAVWDSRGRCGSGCRRTWGRARTCRETWDPSTIGVLAEHIRVEAFRRSADRRVEPCWCPWPTPVDRMGPLCSAVRVSSVSPGDHGEHGEV